MGFKFANINTILTKRIYVIIGLLCVAGLLLLINTFAIKEGADAGAVAPPAVLSTTCPPEQKPGCVPCKHSVYNQHTMRKECRDKN